MNLELFTEQVWNQANSANACLAAGEKAACLSELVDLRDMLNEQPMLEAGGAYDSSVPPDHGKD